MGSTAFNPPSLEHLTPRERQILGMIGQGLSIPEIAERLFRSQKTVETHRLALGRKLGANNRVALARIAIRHGLAPLEREPGRQDRDARDELTQQSPAWHALRNIEATVSTGAGPGYFRKLLTCLSNNLSARCAMVAEIFDDQDSADKQTRIRVQANLGGGQVADPQTMLLTDSVFAALGEHKTVRLDEDLAARFPDCPLVQRMGTRHFLGTRLDDVRGRPIGMLGLMHDQAPPASLEPEHILNICASRASVELERSRMEEQLREAGETLEAKVRQRTADLESANRELRNRITRQRRAEADLHDSQQRYLALVETMNEGLAMLDRQGHLMFVNQQFARMYGRPKEQLIGHHATEFLPDHEAQRFQSLYTQRLANELSHYHLTIKRPDNSQIVLEITTRSLFNDQHQYIGSLGVIRQVEPD